MNTAEIYGVADRYGSIQPGKVANLVVWPGDPFENATLPEAVLVRGRLVPMRSRQSDLLERYRTLEEGRPPAYRHR